MRRVLAALLVAIGLAACGGGGGGSEAPAPTPFAPATVTISWNANRESGVNRAGGGYEVSVTGHPTRDVPFISGSAAPTSTIFTLPTGTYTASVRAYAALDAQGGTTRNYSTASTRLVVVP
jgi:hypothetical protein